MTSIAATATDAVQARSRPASGPHPHGDDRAVRRHRALVASGVVVALLAALNVVTHLVPGTLWLGPAAAAVLLAVARVSGLSWEQLGLGRRQLAAGLRWGTAAVLVIGAVYAVGVLLPATRTAFLDARYHLPLPGALTSAFVAIPLGTVLVEELAFRSVLWGALARHLHVRWVLVTSSALFGLWHVLPSLHLASANKAVGDVVGGGASATVAAVAATVAFTAVGGLVAGELRRRSGSVLASMGMHWATNGLGVLVGIVAWHLAG